jgi:hypothetical protein
MGRGGTPKPRCFNDKCNKILSTLQSVVKVKESGKNNRTQIGLVCWDCNFYFIKNPYTGIITAVQAGNAVPEAEYVRYTGGN